MATYMWGSMDPDNNKTSFWNRELTKPVTCNLPVFPSFSQCEVLNSGRKTLSECLRCLSQQELLSTENYVLRRLVYMKHGQLRSEKSYQGLKQIRTCVRKFFGLDLEKTVKELNFLFQDAVIQEGIRVYLPSRQMWEHLLTQFLAAAALLSNTASRCCTVFFNVHQHLAAGMLIPTNMVFLSMLSRIWACCQGLCLEIQSWYQLLRPVADVLKSTEVAWLPEGEGLPEDLSVWLTEQGFSSGLGKLLQGNGGDGDSLTSLMAKYQEQEEEDQDDQKVDLSLNRTLPMPYDEDLGNPVDVRKVERWNRMEEPSVPQEQDQSLSMGSSGGGGSGSKTGLKEKIKGASTIQDLQKILRKFQKKCPDISANKQTQRCSELLATLQSRSQALERKGQKARTQNLFKKARKKLLKFFTSLTSKSESTPASSSPGEQPSLTKKKRKGNKNLVDSQPNVTSAQSVQDESEVKKTTKQCAVSVSEIKRKKKRQKVSKTVVKEGGENTKLLKEGGGKRKQSEEGGEKRKLFKVGEKRKLLKVGEKRKLLKEGKKRKLLKEDGEKRKQVKDGKKRKQLEEDGEKRKQLPVTSTSTKENLGCRKRKKNDPMNNKMKAAQVKQKKKKARKV